MNILKRLFTPPKAAGNRGTFYDLSVKCARCGEVVTGRVNLNNDLSYEDTEDGEGAASTMAVRKVLIGNARCFQPIEVVLRFDTARNLLERKVTGGTFVD